MSGASNIIVWASQGPGRAIACTTLRVLAVLEIAGVDLLSDVVVIVKSRMRTQPTSRWQVLREYSRRIKLAFDAAGIQIMHKK